MIFFKGPGWGTAAWVGAAIALCALTCRADHPGPQAPVPPALRIEVAPLGYMPPSAFYLTYRLSSMAMGFFDKDHLLFTFRVGGLLRRVPGQHSDDEDQQIRAMVLDVRTGQISKQTEWRMHDRSRYLWAYPDGKFLVRIRDSLYLTDKSLELEPYLSFDTMLRVVEVSPDRKTTLLETDIPGQEQRDVLGEEVSAQRKKVKVAMLPSGAQTASMTSEAGTPVDIPLVSGGFLDFLEGKQAGTWAMRDVLFHGDPKIVAEVKSSCQPNVQPVSASVVLVMGCYQQVDADRPVYAISTDGDVLWQQRWQTKYVWGSFAYAENGNRFAYESVQVDRPISVFDSLDPEDVAQQLVGVYDTRTGKMVLLKNATPVLTAGQNMALSPDGSRFAVLRNGAIEIYDLPPVEEKPAETAVAKKK